MIPEMAACVLCGHILLCMALGVGQSAASQMAEIFITNIPPGFVIFQSRWAQLIEVFSPQPCNRCLLTVYWPSRYWPNAWGSPQPRQVGWAPPLMGIMETLGPQVNCSRDKWQWRGLCSKQVFSGDKGEQMFYKCFIFAEVLGSWKWRVRPRGDKKVSFLSLLHIFSIQVR